MIKSILPPTLESILTQMRIKLLENLFKKKSEKLLMQK